ncbi:MAG: ATP-binding protein [Halioglobus sp.]
MSFSLTQILAFIVIYLAGLFIVALLADRGILPRRLTHHPAVYVLSLGVFAGAMASYGTVELAHRYGYNFLLYYAGAVLMFVLATLLMVPMLRLCRVYQLSSLADVLTFRFRSQWVGAAITVAMCITVLPLLALQIQAVDDSIHILAGDAGYLLSGRERKNGLALTFCVIITVFSILFGTRHVASQQRNNGLVTAIAFESLLKLVALMVVFAAAVFGIFDGFEDMNQWIAANPTLSGIEDNQLESNSARALLLIFFAGAVCMPHIFHLAFAENTDSKDLLTASWGLPLYLLLLSLPILPVAWAGVKMGHNLPMDYTALAIGMSLQSTTVSIAAFVAGLSAASAAIIVTTLALANMVQNHLVLPAIRMKFDSELDIYNQLKWLRRTLIILLILAGYIFYVVISGRETLTQLALIAFIGTLQFLPGIVATFYWPGANRNGLLAGLSGGLGIWFFTLLTPLFSRIAMPIPTPIANILGTSDELWASAAIFSLGLNISVFIAVSLLTKTSGPERVAAEICSMDEQSLPTRKLLAARTTEEFSQQLSLALGSKMANTEVARAMQELQFDEAESRPYALRRLRSRIEANLSGLLGPAVAHSIVNRCIPFQQGPQEGLQDINLIERNLDSTQVHFTGLAADLDNLRRHYRTTLDNLPIGVCSFGGDGELLIWNRSMENTTGIDAEQVLGSLLDSLDEPWRGVIGDFILGSQNTVLKKEITINGANSRWVSLHKASLEAPSGNIDRIILVEDITDYELMERELLHSERLASIGQLAAGIAHEIGNPVTGIACLAQNLEYETDTSEVRYTAAEILKQTDRVTRIVESLVNFSHVGSSTGEIVLTPSNLADCVDEAVHLLQLDQEAKSVHFDNRTGRELLVLADSQRLLQVMINLLGNARDACETDGNVTITANLIDSQVFIDVEDDGCGIAPGQLSQVFDPFYTTKDPGKGTGLGLALVYSIMNDMAGNVAIESPISSGQHPGTRVTLELPVSSYGTEFEI